MSFAHSLKTWTPAQRAVVWASMGFGALFVLALVFPPRDEAMRKLVFNVAQIVTPLIGGVLSVAWADRSAEDTSSQRRGWLWIGTAILLYAMGQIVWMVYECVLKIEAPLPSWSDAFFLSQAIVLNIGVYMLFGGMRATGRVRLLLDSAIASSSFTVLIWYFVIGRAWSQSDVSIQAKLIGVAYPIFDIASLFSAAILFNGVARDRRLRFRISLLVAGIMLQAGADVGFNFYTIEGLYKTGSWPDAGWTLGWMLISYACLLPQGWPQFWEMQHGLAEDKEPEAGTAETTLKEVPLPNHVLLRTAAPYVAVVAAFLIIAWQDYHQSSGHMSNSVFGIGWALILLVIARQVFTLLENQQTLLTNRALTEQLQLFNENLEGTVAQRTMQLSALHGITGAVNNTLDRDEVLCAAAAHIPLALPIDALILHLNADAQGEAPAFHLQHGLDHRLDVFEFLAARMPCEKTQVMVLPVGVDGCEGACCLCAPLSWQGQIMGAISVIRCAGGFGPTEPQLLESIGLAVGTALENARRFKAVWQAEQDLKASLEEKEVLLKEIHHRVKNNMQVISSMLNMQSNSIDDAAVHEMFSDSQNRIKSMALIHERLYQTSDLAHIDFGDYLRSLTANLMRSYRVGSVGLKIDVEPLPLNIDTAVPCGLIINELVSNALKHAFSGVFPREDSEPTLRVSLHSLPDGWARLQVSDNGGGFPASVDWRATESLGLQLVTTLIDQVDGTIQLERHPNGHSGTRWTILLPPPAPALLDSDEFPIANKENPTPDEDDEDENKTADIDRDFNASNQLEVLMV